MTVTLIDIQIISNSYIFFFVLSGQRLVPLCSSLGQVLHGSEGLVKVGKVHVNFLLGRLGLFSEAFTIR